MGLFGRSDKRQETMQRPTRPAPRTGDHGVALKLAMRKLWSDHVVWTRDYVVAAVAGSPSADASSKRLLRNQDDLGKAIEPYYGKPAGDQLTKLLKEHIMIAVDLVDGAKTGNQKKLKDADARWTANANEIARFLSGANPNLPQKSVADLLSLHLKLTKDEATARIKQDWVADTKAFDDIYTEILTLADALADAIVKQFPAKF